MAAIQRRFAGQIQVGGKVGSGVQASLADAQLGQTIVQGGEALQKVADQFNQRARRSIIAGEVNQAESDLQKLAQRKFEEISQPFDKDGKPQFQTLNARMEKELGKIATDLSKKFTDGKSQELFNQVMQSQKLSFSKRSFNKMREPIQLIR